LHWIEVIKKIQPALDWEKNNEECNQHWIDEKNKEYNLNLKTNSNLHWSEEK
jgi:hypothetical protein